jgi:hypothetical protein
LPVRACAPPLSPGISGRAVERVLVFATASSLAVLALLGRLEATLATFPTLAFRCLTQGNSLNFDASYLSIDLFIYLSIYLCAR